MVNPISYGWSCSGFRIFLDGNVLCKLVRYCFRFFQYKILCFNFSYCGCHLAGDISCIVDANGDVYPCFLSLDYVKARNGVVDGWERAFYTTPTYYCDGCYYPCHIEMYYLHKLELSAIKNVMNIWGIIWKDTIYWIQY